MEFKCNENLLFEEKVAQVSKEIKECYPELDNDTAIKIASLCDTITNTINEDVKFNRYYNILNCISDYNLFNKVFHNMVSDCNNKLTNEVYVDVYKDIIKYYHGELAIFPNISDYYE